MVDLGGGGGGGVQGVATPPKAQSHTYKMHYQEYITANVLLALLILC